MIKNLINDKKGSSIAEIAIGITIFLIVIGIVFAPVGLNAAEDRNDVHTVSYLVTNITRTNIAPDTQIYISYTNVTPTQNFSEANFNLYYRNILTESVSLLNASAPTTYTTGGGTFVLNLTNIQTANTALTVTNSIMYGTGSTGTTLFNAFVPIILASMVILVIYRTMK